MEKKMTNLRIFSLVFIMGLILAGCKKSETATDNIVGTWTAGSATYSAMVGDKTLLQYFTDVVGLSAEDAQTQVNLIAAILQQSLTGTITVKSDKTYTSTLGGTPDSGTWSLSADEKKLTIDSSTEDPVIMDVQELSSSKMILGSTETRIEDLNGDSVDETIIVTLTVTFNK
jgi:hypothetical protein